MLGFWNCVVFVDDHSACRDFVFVVRARECGATVPRPQKIPLVDIAVWRRQGHLNPIQIFVDVEVYWLPLVLVAMRHMGWIEILRRCGCAFDRLNEQTSSFGEILHLALQSDIPIDIALEDES